MNNSLSVLTSKKSESEISHSHSNKQNDGKDLMGSYQRTVFGTNELIRKTWEIIDNPRTKAKEKIKAISLAQQLHNQAFEYKKLKYQMIVFEQYAQQIVKKEQEIYKREKDIRDYIQGDKSKENEILNNLKLQEQQEDIRI
jgi:hypothetical protein